MKYIKTFENNRFKAGDYVYPRKEYCWSPINHVLKPIKYKVLSTTRKFGEEYIEVDQIDTSKYDSIFPSDWFMSELEYDSNKFNI